MEQNNTSPSICLFFSFTLKFLLWAIRFLVVICLSIGEEQMQDLGVVSMSNQLGFGKRFIYLLFVYFELFLWGVVVTDKHN